MLSSIRLPGVVVEIVPGILVGPAVLGWVRVDLPVQLLAILGLAFRCSPFEGSRRCSTAA